MGVRMFSSSLLLSCLLLSGQSLAITLDCSRIVVGNASYDLSELGGPKSVHHQLLQPPSISNTTFTIDLCKSLTLDTHIPHEDQCDPNGTRVCGVETVHNPTDKTSSVVKVIHIAGEFTHSNGRHLDPVITRLKGSASNSDAEKDGLRIELHGGKYPDARSGQKQSAIIEIICDPEKSGNEGFAKAEASVDTRSKDIIERRDDKKDDDNEDKEPELPDLDKDKSLQFVSYKPGQDEEMVLRMMWKSKYACEDAAVKKPDDAKPSSGWGFFTWFIIIVFLLIASYIIFGSWLNYNRYGARGWDLVPHGDFIRDLPYIAKDWASNVNERIRGGNLRGGYSAV